jgi:hypothetical protein
LSDRNGESITFPHNNFDFVANREVSHFPPLAQKVFLFCDRIKIAIIGADVGPFPFVIRPLLSATSNPLYSARCMQSISGERVEN